MKDLAIAYEMRKRAMKRKLAQGGIVEPEEPMHAEVDSIEPMSLEHHDMPEPMEEPEPEQKRPSILDAIMQMARTRHKEIV